MPADEPHLSRVGPSGDALESYRRLIELQKQMIELSRQHAESKRECAVLRDQVAREMTNGRRARRTLTYRAQQSASKLLRRLPGFASAETKLGLFINKQLSSC